MKCRGGPQLLVGIDRLQIG